LRTPEALVTQVLTLLAYGCPVPAIVAAFGVDERTVASWRQRAGEHCRQVHEATVQQGQVDLQHVQADELWVKRVGGRVWMALALAVPSRLWLGGELSPSRNLDLIRALVQQVRQAARSLEMLVCVDGLASYVTAFCHFFKEKVPTGRRGAPCRRLPAGFLLGQVVKSAVRCRVVEVAHRAVVGTLAQIEQRLQATGGGQVLNTAYIERLNATFRSRLAPLIRRGRCLARKQATLQAGMYLVGTVYNFCSFHDSLRRRAPHGEGRKWQERTPAMAAGLTEARWEVGELLHYRVRPKPLDLEKWRGKHRKGAVARPKSRMQPALCASTV
jgi:transposase-like protein